MKNICLYFEVHQPYHLRLYRFFDIGKHPVRPRRAIRAYRVRAKALQNGHRRHRAGTIEGAPVVFIS